MAFVQISTDKTRKGGDSIQKLVESGRTTGKYRLLGAGLEEVPYSVYDGEPLDGVAFWDEVPPQALDISRNELQKLPNELGRLTDLVSISVSHNKLAALPSSMSLLTGLKTLDISHNQFDTGPAALTAMASLQQLSCGFNQLTSLQLGHFPELVQLSAEDNRLKSLPHGLAGCIRMSRLSLSGNALTRLPEGVLKDLLELKELDLSSNQLEGILDPSIGALTLLKVLTLRQNRLSALPAEIAGCTSLAELHLGFNQINRLPDELGKLSSLAVLDIRNNTLMSFPAGACRLSLSLLDLSNNDLAMLPPELGKMTSLRALPLSGNPIRGIRPTVINGPISALLAALRHRLEDEENVQGAGPSAQGAAEIAAAGVVSLAISSNSNDICLANQGLSDVPQQIWDQGVQPKRLDLSSNKLRQLPVEKVAGLSGLQTLLLAHNQLQSWPLPASQDAMPRLQELTVAFNPQLRLPENAFCACAAYLTCLDLSGVPASQHMVCLGALKALRSLQWEKATLTTFPQAITQLTALQTLSLMSNQIAEVPEAVTQLTSLTLLNLSNCSIASLPPRLGLLEDSLRTLMLEGNPLRTIRRPILQKGTKEVLQYLRDRIPA